VWGCVVTMATRSAYPPPKGTSRRVCEGWKRKTGRDGAHLQDKLIELRPPIAIVEPCEMS
jgi:hypothetical protein